MIDGLVVDRGRITHGESRRATVMQLEVQKAAQRLDFERVDALYKEADRLLMKVVVSVPDGWLPEGVTLETPDWIQLLSQDKYEELSKLAEPPMPGQKKA